MNGNWNPAVAELVGGGEGAARRLARRLEKRMVKLNGRYRAGGFADEAVAVRVRRLFPIYHSLRELERGAL